MTVTLPTIQRLERSDTEGVINAIIKDGCCVVKGFADADTISTVNKEVQPYLEADKPWKGDLFPPETRRCPNLVGRSPTARNTWFIDPLIRAVNATFIDKTTSNYYGETKHTYTSGAVCTISLTFDIGPGAQAQRLHRDDKNYHVDHVDQTGYRVGSDVLIGYLIAGVTTSYENGATLAIPGSHLWDDERVPYLHEATYAALEQGDMWIMLGSLYHAGGANMTQHERRVVHGFFFTRGYMRQEENAYLANSAEEVLSWNPQAQKAMGYTLSSPNVGAVLFRTPLDYLSRRQGDDFGDFDPSQETK
ncbi:hypothetical protein H2202_006747 [Exophiala xenobiotica]|nr:hypothetical protein H2202_006747 [Exophiala xenobiotica]KAK5228044.1 hypothetical protein LTR72_001927 [Exophiala xenobiotica]KAK5238883.1 hypothetical protein LTR47_000626 [Exophiala xenobiotica]KAK5255805.1 hypothetical protein LTS06_000261 [Exophiala xenobiotica]KAK5302521.1 hypothetical protein LTR14_000770 [Exophiala xenobiotica]